MDDGLGRSGEHAPRSHPPRRKPRGSDVGVTSESCSREVVGLDRFASASKLYKPNLKSGIERLINPFGDPWSQRKFNPYIPVMTGSCRDLLARTRLDLMHGMDGGVPGGAPYVHYTDRASGNLHYDETVSRLAPDMPRFREMKQAFKAVVSRYVLELTAASSPAGRFSTEAADSDDDAHAFRQTRGGSAPF